MGLISATGDLSVIWQNANPSHVTETYEGYSSRYVD